MFDDILDALDSEIDIMDFDDDALEAAIDTVTRGLDSDA